MLYKESISKFIDRDLNTTSKCSRNVFGPDQQCFSSWMTTRLLPSSSVNDPKPTLFHSKHHHIYLGILDSDMLHARAWCTLPFFWCCTSVTFKMLWMFSRPNMHPLKNSGLDSRNGREKNKQNLLQYPLNLYKHLKFYSHQIHLIIQPSKTYSQCWII